MKLKLLTLLASLLVFTSLIVGQSPTGLNNQISGTIEIPAGLDPTLADGTPYDILIIEDPSGTPSLIQTLDFVYDNLNGNSVPFAGNLNYSSDYSWAVQIDGYGYTTYLQYQTDAIYGEYLFSTIDQLTAASNLAPDGLADQTLTPTLTWDPATGGTIPYTYTVNIYDDALLTSLVWSGVLNSGDPVPGGQLDFNTNYWWEVVTDDDSDPAQQETSVDAQFKTGFPDLTLDTPADGFSSSDRTPTLTWSTASPVSNVTYTLDVTGNNGFAQNSPETSPYTFGANLNYGTYTWDVTIDDSNTPLDNTPVSSSNGPWTFDVVPELVSPVNSITGVSIKPTLEWVDDGVATGYRIQIATSTDFVGDLVLEHSVGAGIDNYKFNGYFHPEIPLNNNTKYYWRVIAEVGGNDYASQPWYFTTVANINISLWNPGDNIELYLYDPATFTWSINQAQGSLKFFLQIIEQPLAPDYVQWASFEITAAQGANPVLWFDNINDLYRAVNSLDGGSKFYWRVCAYYDDGSASNVFDFDDRVVKYSSVFSFTTKGGAVKAYPSWPIGGPIYYLDPTFYWYTMQWEPGAHFTVMYSTDNTVVGDSLVNGVTEVYAGTNTYVYIGTDLNPSTTYYWQVRTRYGNEYNYSSVAEFTTYDAPGLVPTAANPSYPTGGLEIYTTAPTFYWWIGAMNVDVNYEVEVSTDNTFGTIDFTFGPTTDLYVQGSGLLPGEYYYWRIKASKTGYPTVYSSTAEFSVTGGLNSYPVANWPVGNPTVYTNTPTLSWYFEGSTLGWFHYKVVWSKKDKTPAEWLTQVLANDSIYVTADMNETFYTFTSPLEYGETYYWAVAAHDHPAGPYSDFAEGSFTIAGNNASIVQTNPANNTVVLTKSPSFYWYVTGSLLGVTHFRVTYSNTELFNANVETVTTTTTNASVNSPLTEGATYWWYVELSYDNGVTWENPSSTWKFTVDPGANAVVPMVGSPARGVTISSNSPTLSWFLPAQSQSALSYEVEVSNSSDFSNATKYENLEQLNAKVTELSDGEYFWRVRSKTDGSTSEYSSAGNFKIGSVTSVEDTEELPLTYNIDQNYPNPFNPTTTINYSLPEANHVTIKIYDMLGQEVRTLLSQEVKAGRHSVEWKGDNNYGSKVSSGTYIYRISAGEYMQAKKMILLK
ncbi:MAG: T9SS type A sorting domain-containing protein [Melioribacteraceae bacterium]|nr:T9SS type A sorting domain-containing protein [Melioribacteraceae bacterium]